MIANVGVLIAVFLKIQAFWDLVPCRPKNSHWRIEGTELRRSVGKCLPLDKLQSFGRLENSVYRIIQEESYSFLFFLQNLRRRVLFSERVLKCGLLIEIPLTTE